MLSDLFQKSLSKGLKNGSRRRSSFWRICFKDSGQKLSRTNIFTVFRIRIYPHHFGKLDQDRIKVKSRIRIRSKVKKWKLKRARGSFWSIEGSKSVADPDPGLGAFLTPGSGIRDPGWEKVSIRIRDPG
jgi:hypothetical protein